MKPNEASQVSLSTRDWIGFISMIVGMFMAVLDIQIVSSSLQNIQSGLSATQDEISWIQTAYLIAEVIIIPLSGWLSQACSTRILYTVSCAGFTLMSFACAFAWNLNAMIAFRFLQGLFGGAMIPTVFATIFTLFPLSLQPMMTVIVGLVVTIAPTLGPILGGYLTEISSWHMLFLINILPGIFVCTSTWLFVNLDKPDWQRFKQIDFLGIALIATCLGTLEFVLEEGSKKGWFDSSLIIGLSCLVFTSFFLMLWRELHYEHPIIDLHALKVRNFAIGCIYSFIIGWGLFGVTFLMPLYLGSIKGLNSFQIGSYVMVTGVFQFVSAPLAGYLSQKIDLRVMLAMGLAAFSVGTYMNSLLTFESGYWEFFIPQAIRGLSLMFCFLPINTLALGSLPVAKVKNASGLYNLMRNLGGAIGLAVTNTYIINASKTHYAILREHVTATDLNTTILLGHLKARMMHFNVPHPHLASLKLLYATAEREAAIITFNEVFQGIACLFIIALCFMPGIKAVKNAAESS